jgi:hypothetical protein
LEKLGSILARIRLPGPGPLQAQQIAEAVFAVLGDATRDVRVASFRAGRLVIECASAAQAFELEAFAREELLARLKGKAGLEALAEVTFRNGSGRLHGRA